MNIIIRYNPVPLWLHQGNGYRYCDGSSAAGVLRGGGREEEEEVVEVVEGPLQVALTQVGQLGDAADGEAGRGEHVGRQAGRLVAE